MLEQHDPPESILGVLGRTQNVLMTRVRESEYDDVAAQQTAMRLKGLMFLHLKRDLHADPVDWEDCQVPHDLSQAARPVQERGPLTSYGILKSIQLRLAEIRTDLDSFTDVEAYGLMLSGYEMTRRFFPDSLKPFCAKEPKEAAWRFRQMATVVSDVKKSAALDKQLSVSDRRFFKVWLLSPRLKAFGVVLVLAALIGAGWWLWENRHLAPFTVGGLTITLVTMVVLARVGTFFNLAHDVATGCKKIIVTLALAIVGWAIAGIHLIAFDRLFLCLGKASRVLPGNHDE
jgi:hypothetical protein